jgi:hypothetical protein
MKRYAIHLCGPGAGGTYFDMGEFTLHLETHKCGRRGKPFCRTAKKLKVLWWGPGTKRRGKR